MMCMSEREGDSEIGRYKYIHTYIYMCVCVCVCVCVHRERRIGGVGCEI